MTFTGKPDLNPVLIEPVRGFLGPVVVGIAGVKNFEGVFGIVGCVFMVGFGAAVAPRADYVVKSFRNARVVRVGFGPIYRELAEPTWGGSEKQRGR